jgi:hypothetical protein
MSDESARPLKDDFTMQYWRQGRKVGRTIYARLGHKPSDSDPLIGVMDTAQIAGAAVRAHNRFLDRLWSS